MLGILWLIVAILLLFWVAGLVLGLLGDIIWIVLVIALAIALYNLIAGRTAH